MNQILSRCFTGLFVLVAAFPLFAFAADSKSPTPEWIWQNNDPAAAELVYLRKNFQVEGEVKQATLTAACDNQVAVFFNGEHLLQHGSWERPFREDVTKKLKAGNNALVMRCSNQGSAAGLIVKLTIEMTDGVKQVVISDKSWKATAEPEEAWREIDFDTSNWTAAYSFGKLGVAPWGPVPLDDSANLELATPVDAITVPDGFQVELLYSVPKGQQGSWVSMTPDSKGRLICSDQYGGLYRVTPGADAESTQVEALDVAIGDAQGLLYVFDSLYVTVNGSAAQGSGFYRLRDTDGDDQFDEVELLSKFQGGGEHGPHGIRLGPDGKLYVIAGNHTKIPENLASDSPHRNWAEDLLLPRNPDGRGHATGVMAPGGWIARTDKDGQTWELVCAGYRNPYDIDFNQEGELFTYDADMEWDTGVPWYRPTRVNHARSAAEFGWRYGTGKWPEYYVDSVGAVVDIGLGSPTGIGFGTGAKFPAAYQRALYINDWTYGKIYAVHMAPDGATYTGTFETFVAGKPLPVTDVVVNTVDRALYFTIGGRRTQSGLYRVTYVGSESTDPAGPIENEQAAAARALRHKLEAFHGKSDPQAVTFAWPHLNSLDRAIRYAARVAVEHQDLDQWRDKALAEARVSASIQALLALTRIGGEDLQAPVLEKLNALPLERMTEEQVLDALRVYQLAFIRLGGKSSAAVEGATSRLSPLLPAQSDLVNRELTRMLVYLEAPGVIARAMQLLEASRTQQDQMFYAFVLRNAENGWSPAHRQAYFSWLNLAEGKYRGGASFKNFVQQIRDDAVKTLSEAEKLALKDVLEGRQSVEVVELETSRQFIHNWQMEDLEPLLAQATSGRSFEKGKLAYEAAQCAKCHRFAGEGGATGPDITGVGNRFSPLYILESFIVPSKAVSDQYVQTVIITSDGEVITGRVIDETPTVVRVRTSPFARELTEIAKDKIEDQQISKISEMPVGLINVLTPEEILDLIAYLRSGGNADDPVFAKK